MILLKLRVSVGKLTKHACSSANTVYIHLSPHSHLDAVSMAIVALPADKRASPSGGIFSG